MSTASEMMYVNRRAPSAGKIARFIWIENGTEVDLGDTGIPGVSGAHKLVGFKPAPGRKVGGWLVVLVNQQAQKSKPHIVRLRKLRG